MTAHIHYELQHDLLRSGEVILQDINKNTQEIIKDHLRVTWANYEFRASNICNKQRLAFSERVNEEKIVSNNVDTFIFLDNIIDTLKDDCKLSVQGCPNHNAEELIRIENYLSKKKSG